MIRILFDEMGDSHSDILLKVDAMPSFVQVADTYFLGDFLSKEFKTKEEEVLGYLDYFKEEIQGLKEEEVFIPFDLSDQYVGGLFVAHGKKGLLKVEFASTAEIVGFGISQESVTKQVKENRNSFNIDFVGLISKEEVIKGLNWSIERIKKLSIQ